MRKKSIAVIFALLITLLLQIYQVSGADVYQVNTIADLRNISSQSAASLGTVQVRGYYVVGDGGGGPARCWKTSGAYVDNGGSVIVPTDGDGSAAWIFVQSSDNIQNWGAKANVTFDNTDYIQSVIDNERSFSAGIGDLVFNTSNPVMLRSGSHITGSGQKAPRIGSTIHLYGGILKTTNNTVTITNPEIPTQTVNCLFYLNGEWEDSIYPQKFVIDNMSLQTSVYGADSVGIYVIQGGNYTLRNVDIFDFDYAVNGYDVWSCLFEKVVTNGKIRFHKGTSAVFNQCASGGTGNSGNTTGGFVFDELKYSTLNSCTSDGGTTSAYYFKNCYAMVLNGCGSEFTSSASDDYGNCLAFDTGNQATINSFFGFSNYNATRAAISVASSNKITITNSKFCNTAGGENYDLVITGNNSYVKFNRTQFSNLTYDEPKIRFNPGVTNSLVVVQGVSSDCRPKIYYSDGNGNTLVRYGLVESGSNANGYYTKFDDGTLICHGILEKNNFLTSTSYYTTVQGLNIYRSGVTYWIYPHAFIDTNISINIQPVTGTVGARWTCPRLSSAGQSTTRTGEIQLIGLENFTVGENGYENLTEVHIQAIGRWK